MRDGRDDASFNFYACTSPRGNGGFRARVPPTEQTCRRTAEPHPHSLGPSCHKPHLGGGRGGAGVRVPGRRAPLVAFPPCFVGNMPCLPPRAPREPVSCEILRADFCPVLSGSPRGATQPPAGDPGDEVLTIPRGSLASLGEHLASRKFSIVWNPKRSPQSFPQLGN